MPRPRYKTYLKAHRLKAALTQAEVAGLLGLTPNAVSQYELGKRGIPVEVLIASEVIFGVSAAKLFPALYNGVEEDLAIRALELHERLAGLEDPKSRKKLALIGGIPGSLH
jgi:transcriptional regulator with XRE-family HTH domain